MQSPPQARGTTPDRTRSALRRRLTALLLPALLSGCGADGPAAAFENYLARLGRTLAVAPQPVQPTQPLPRPRTGQIHLDVAPGKLDALDFLALSGCAVQVTIGKRNSSLGRLARASQRLLLELEYLRLAPACSASRRERGEEALAASLEQAWLEKRQQLPALLFNATLGSAEYREFWQPPARAGAYPANTNSAVISALQGVNSLARRWLAGDYRADNLEFELLLGEIARGDGGALLQALASQGAWLAAANGLIEQRLARGPLCTPGIRPAAADIVKNVIGKYFIGDIQPWSAAVGRRYHQLVPPVAQLEHLLGDTLPPAYRNWQLQRDSQLATLIQAPRLHVERLQALQQPCQEQ